MNLKDLTGKRFGRLVVLKRDFSSEKKGVRWLCKCDCGNEKIILGQTLLRGKAKSCGCYRKECGNIQKFSTKHNKSHSKIYKTWQCMKSRCYDKNDKYHYKDYGGRGISICNEWLSDFMNFYNWAITNGYKDGLTIDRIDVNGNYEPNNCRWATKEEQANNRRKTQFITYNNETHTINEWCKILNLKKYVLRQRLKNYGITDKTFFKGRLPFSWKGRNKGVKYELRQKGVFNL